MSADPEELRELETAAGRLEEVAARIAAGGATGEELRGLADEAVRLSGEIGERLPRALRAEDR